MAILKTYLLSMLFNHDRFGKRKVCKLESEAESLTRINLAIFKILQIM
jgi:hypothetical protein